MSDPSANRDLSTETAEVLLTAIKSATPGADDRGVDALKNLADAYRIVTEAMPKPPPRSGRAVVI